RVGGRGSAALPGACGTMSRIARSGYGAAAAVALTQASSERASRRRRILRRYEVSVAFDNWSTAYPRPSHKRAANAVRSLSPVGERVGVRGLSAGVVDTRPPPPPP